MEIIGWFYTLCFAICYIPQIFKSLKTKKVDDISVTLFMLSLTGYIAAIAYTLGEIGLNIILLTNYLFGSLCSFIMIVTFFYYRKK